VVPDGHRPLLRVHILTDERQQLTEANAGREHRPHDVGQVPPHLRPAAQLAPLRVGLLLLGQLVERREQVRALLLIERDDLLLLTADKPELVANLNEWYRVELTYTSNAIEGNTLTRRETALVVEKGITVAGKSLQEHLEATNHAESLDFGMELSTRSTATITANDVLKIHRIILHGIDYVNAGCYRTVPVRTAGSPVVMPNYAKLPQLMDDFFSWLRSTQNDEPVQRAIDAHYRLVSIHPFVDGNGRTARLLMNLLLMQVGFPASVIRPEDRSTYIAGLEKAQRAMIRTCGWFPAR
jgi:Fic family protein